MSIIHVNPTAHKLRLWIPSALRAPAAGYVGRWAGEREIMVSTMRTEA